MYIQDPGFWKRGLKVAVTEFGRKMAFGCKETRMISSNTDIPQEWKQKGEDEKETFPGRGEIQYNMNIIKDLNFGGWSRSQASVKCLATRD